MAKRVEPAEQRRREAAFGKGVQDGKKATALDELAYSLGGRFLMADPYYHAGWEKGIEERSGRVEGSKSGENPTSHAQGFGGSSPGGNSTRRDEDRYCVDCSKEIAEGLICSDCRDKRARESDDHRRRCVGCREEILEEDDDREVDDEDLYCVNCDDDEEEDDDES